MIAIWERLFGPPPAPPCQHKWRETNRYDAIKRTVDSWTGEELHKERVGDIVYCVCEKCGEPRRFDLC